MKKFFLSFVDIRKGEGLLTVLMFSYYYVVLVTYYLLKPARDSLFLVKLGSNQLPLVFILTALIIAPITTIYARASKTLRLTTLVYVTTGILVANLAILRYLLTLDGSWVFYLFYVWVSIYGALTASQYWLFANAVYDSAQGKRIFSLLNLGGILGAMTGGEVTNFLVKTFNIATEDLLYFCMAFLVVVIVLAGAAWRASTSSAPASAVTSKPIAAASESFLAMFGMIRKSRHLLYLVGIIATTMATASFVDYQFKYISVEAYPAKEDLTGFLGTFYGRLSLVSLVLQIVFTYRFLRVLGVVGIVSFLPISLLFGSVSFFIFPGLLTAILLRGADGAFKYSLDKTGRELLFLPVPLEIKKRTKVFIDMFVDRWFRGLAGAVLLLLTTVFAMGPRELSVVVIVLLVFWLWLVFMIRREYVNAFRSALSRREIDLASVSFNVNDPATVNMLRASLRSTSEREVVYALGMLGSSDAPELADDIRPLLAHESADVRAGALENLRRLRADAGDALESLLADEDARVRHLAAQVAIEADDSVTRAKELIAAPHPATAAAALRAVADAANTELRALANATVANDLLSRADGTEERVEIVKALGAIADVASIDRLIELSAGRDVAVAGAALVALGESHQRRAVTTLLDRVGSARLRRYARDGLVAYGPGVVGTVADYMSDQSVPVTVRRYLPAVLSRIPAQTTVNTLVDHLGEADASLRFRIIKALNKLRERNPDLKIPTQPVNDAFIAETRTYFEARQIAALQRGDDRSDADKLLMRALDERLDNNLERIFRLLGLNYSAKDIYNAYLGFTSDEKNRHASAIEFLDNVVGSEKRYLLPIVDEVSEDILLQRGRDLFGLDIKTRDDALLALIRGADSWLRACAVFSAGSSQSSALKEAVAAAVDDPDPLVAETAYRLTRAA